jgi:hypothetical protein
MEPISADHDWLIGLDKAASQGILSEEERQLISLYKSGAKGIQDSKMRTSAKLTDEEKKLLSKFKGSYGTAN